MAQAKTATTNAKNSTKAPMRKLTAHPVKLEIGDTSEGYFLEMKETDFTNPETGELKMQTKVYMEEAPGGNRFYIWGNAGLKSAIVDSCVSKGDHILIERLEKRQLSGGRTKNQYDVFQIQD